MGIIETNGHTDEACGKLPPTTLLEAVRELNTLHQEITQKEGQVVARLNELEQFAESQLQKVRGMRFEIREKQKQMRRIETVLASLAHDVIG